MHSLFTRVFVSFWLSIVLIAAAAAGVTALHFVTDRNNPIALTQQAQSLLTSQGLEGLRSWLTQRNAASSAGAARRSRVLIVGPDGREILGQRMPWRGPPGGMHEMPGRLHGPMPHMEIRDSNGAVYRVHLDPPPRGGPFAPPFAWPVRAGLLLLALAISGLISYLLARSIARPLEGLQGTARELAQGRLSARTAPATGRRRDEIGLLAREFDAMAGRLEELIAARERLLRDISHELRSPLARLQMAVGLARQNRATQLEQLDRIEREGERLEALIAQVLEYARYERDTASLHREPVDLAALLSGIVHDAEFESRIAPGRITLAADQGLPTIAADPELLHAALSNVLRNALLHGGDGPVELRLERADKELRVQVLDRGPGVPPAELERIFEPFYRVPRTLTAAVEGSGIGLALAARALALHGGRITAMNREGGGLVVEIVLPET